jgi:glutaredoxin
LEKNGQKIKTENGINNPKVPELMKKSGVENHKYWPKIFLNGKYFGGYTDLEKRFPEDK